MDTIPTDTIPTNEAKSLRMTKLCNWKKDSIT